MKKIVLLNPPGKKLYIRDYFCSKVSQANYIPHPIDLVMLSGTLSQEYEVFLIDAIVNNLSANQTIEEIKKIQPYAIITLAGAVSLDEDLAFIKNIKTYLPQTKIISIGDAFREDPEKHLNNYPIDAVLLDFATDDILHYLKSDYEKINNMVIRTDGKIISTPINKKYRYFDIPIPKHNLFLKYNYRHPFIRNKKFITTLIDYGCPYPCSFCIMGTLGYKVRNVENLISELKYIKSLGVKEIFFHTQTFGANKNQTKQLCKRMIDEKFNFGWVCFSRVDVTTPDLLEVMKEAGCHTIIFGVESGSEEILKKYKKQYSLNQIISTINYCNKISIETVGTFILGLPEENEFTITQTLNLLKKIKLDYASFNVAVPRAGTDLRKQAIEVGLIDKEFNVMDQSGSEIAMNTKSLTKDEILKYRRKAVFIFYFRLQYIFNRLIHIKSFYDLIRHIKQAIGLVRHTWL